LGRHSSSKPRIVLTGTPQPSEGAQLYTLWALDYLLSEDPVARRFRDTFTFDVVPVTNPDGVALGTTMTNGLGENPVFGAEAVLAGKAASAEATALWQLVAAGPEGKDAPAVGYLEYHAYYQTERPCHPWIVDVSQITDTKQRQTYEKITAALQALSDGHQITVGPDEPRLSKSVFYLATTRLGTVGYLYKLHTLLSGPENKARAIAVLKEFLGPLATR